MGGKNVRQKKSRWILFFLPVWIMLAGISARAESGSRIEIPVSVELSGEGAPEVFFEVEMTSLTEGAPVPEANPIVLKASEKSFVLSLDGVALGDYLYEVRLHKGKDPRIDYDEGIYQVKLQVLNNPESEKESQVGNLIIEKEGKAGKQDCILFCSRFTADTAPSTGDEWNALPWLLGLILSLGVLLGLAIRRIKA